METGTSHPSVSSFPCNQFLLQEKMEEYSAFMDVTPCSPAKVHRSFGGTYYLNLQGRSKEKAIRRQ
jgi:hypothetical protein